MTSCVAIGPLQERASSIISEHTGAEAGIVTSGASAALLLAAAACLTGLSPERMRRLPHIDEKDQILIPRSHRNLYDHAIRAAGAKLVEVGIADRFSGAGVRDTEAWELGEAIGEHTAAILYVAQTHSQPPLEQVIEQARTRNIPVIVDAAGRLPPKSNLNKFIKAGADLVCFSGGKAIGGPQGTGILCGRRRLVGASALQLFDQDVLPELWKPPVWIASDSSLPGAPHHGIGRPCKVGKEQIVGLLVALQRFVAISDHERIAGWNLLAKRLLDGINGAPCSAAVTQTNDGVPIVTVRPEEYPALEITRALQGGEPAIYINEAGVREGILCINPMCLNEQEVPIICARLRELLKPGR
jgi:L-seryl-tRNA(Ser) seleniumtransferase